VKKPKLLPYERVLVKALSKRLPVNAFVSLWYHRSVMWSEAGNTLKIPPSINNSMTLRITIVDPENVRQNLGRFEWEGNKLEDGIKAFDRWAAEFKANFLKAAAAQQLQITEVRSLPPGRDEGALFP
jgi:hypothetical protein